MPRGGGRGGAGRGGARPPRGRGPHDGGGSGAGGGRGGNRPGRGEPRDPHGARRAPNVRRGAGEVDERAIAPERLVYGRHPLREALRGPRTVKAVWGTAAALRDMGDEVATAGVPVHTVDSAEVEVRAGTGDHQGLAAEVEPFSYVAIEDLVASSDAPVLLCLDQVTDPHNLGAIARVCDASGSTGIVVTEHRSAKVTGAVCKASAGAIEHVRVAQVTNLADALDRIKGADLWVYGASERGERSYTDADLTGGVALVFGSEGAGLRPRVREHCDDLLGVPMRGGVSSLNVSTVAALFAYEVVRQRGAGA